jgi:hypothetical protein
MSQNYSALLDRFQSASTRIASVRTWDEYLRLPQIYLSDLVQRNGALFAQKISQADDRWLIVYTFQGGRQVRQITAACRIH